MQKAAVDEFFRRLAKRAPEPKTELTYGTPFQLLVAVVLSAQSTDAGVNKATPALFKKAPTPRKMADLGPAGVEAFIKTIGLYRTKAKNVARLAQQLVDDHGGEVPHDRDALQALPGVGRKTASVVLNAVWGDPEIAVDTHVFRVANRTGLAKAKTPEDVETKLGKVVPDQWKRHAHHWLILHGRYTCVARKPKCPLCPVIDLCAFKDKTQMLTPDEAKETSPEGDAT